MGSSCARQEMQLGTLAVIFHLSREHHFISETSDGWAVNLFQFFCSPSLHGFCSSCCQHQRGAADFQTWIFSLGTFPLPAAASLCTEWERVYRQSTHRCAQWQGYHANTLICIPYTWMQHEWSANILANIIIFKKGKRKRFQVNM